MTSEVRTILTSGANRLVSVLPDQSNDGYSFLYTRSTATLPNEIYTAKWKGVGAREPIVHRKTFIHESKAQQITMSPSTEFWFKGANGDRVMGYYYKPAFTQPSPLSPNNTNTLAPVAFLVHGGPQAAWDDSFGLRWNVQAFTGAGFAVVAINPHGSVGYGQNFTNAVSRNWGGAPFDDLMLGLDYAIEKFPIDGTRVCALGASYGGYMINWINGHTDRFRCLVNHDGMFDAKTSYFTTDELFFNEYEFGGVPWNPRARKQYYEKWSPSNYVRNWKTPTLVIHGEKDYRLPITEGLATFTALQRRKIPSRLLVFPDENHWVLKPANSLRWYKEVLDWITFFTHPRKADGDVEEYGDGESVGFGRSDDSGSRFIFTE